MNDRYWKSVTIRAFFLYGLVICFYTWGWPSWPGRLNVLGQVNRGTVWLGQTLTHLSVKPGWQDFYVAGWQWIIAFAVALAWAGWERQKRLNVLLIELTAMIARYDLAIAMFYYAVAKLGFTQGSHADSTMLIRPLGEIPFAQYMWLWLGHSSGYEFFGGMIEFLAAVLLLFRRTATLGALLIVVPLLFVCAVDAAYGAGPKATALQYAVLALLVLARDGPRLIDCFLRRRELESRSNQSELGRPGKIIEILLTLLVCGWVGYADIAGQVRTTRNAQARSTLAGIYSVENVTFPDSPEASPHNPVRLWSIVAISKTADHLRIQSLDGHQTILREVGIERFDPEGKDARAIAQRASAPSGTLQFEIVPDIKSSPEYGRFLRVFGKVPSGPDPRAKALVSLAYNFEDSAHLLIHAQFYGENVAMRLRAIKDGRFFGHDAGKQ